MGDTHVEYMRGDTELALTSDTVESFQCTGRESNAPDIFRSGVALTRLYTAQVCELFNWVDSVTIHYYWPSTICCRAPKIADSLLEFCRL